MHKWEIKNSRLSKIQITPEEDRTQCPKCKSYNLIELDEIDFPGEYGCRNCGLRFEP